MGCFSWYTSDTHRALLIHRPIRVYALQPAGDPLCERSYDGDGMFAQQDIYDLVADWNRKYLSEHPNFLIRSWDGTVSGSEKRVSDFDWYAAYADLSNSREDICRIMRKRFSTWQYRHIGIEIACSDANNFRLPYPIKLVQQPVPYEKAHPSYQDPVQGLGYRIRYRKEIRKE